MGNNRDYYADLELPPSADVQDVKKQFRKLALKYHPDRNPGKEQEVNSKFQIIQTAHEVLADPTSKAKYDASYSKGGRYAGSSGVKGNPWSNVSQQFPTPPRRNPNPPRQTPSGAQRWQSRFASGAAPTAKQQFSNDQEAKKNAAKAFESMRKGQAQAPPQVPPRENRAPGGSGSAPRTESARQRAQAAFGNRKSGFQPKSSDDPSTGKSYASKSDSERRQSTAEARRASRASAMPDPLSQFRDRRDQQAEVRQSTPYTSHGGEKTNPFEGVPLGRAKSQREPSRRYETSSSDDAQSFNARKHRSSSVPKPASQDNTSPGLQVPDASQRPHTAGETTGTSNSPSFSERASGGYSPNEYYHNANATSGYDAEPSPGTAQETGARKGSGPNGPSVYAPIRSPKPLLTPHIICNGHDISKKLPSNLTSHTHQNSTQLKTRPEIGSESGVPSGSPVTTQNVTSFEKQQHDLLKRLIKNASVSTLSDPGLQPNSNLSCNHDSARTDKLPPLRFSFNVDGDTFTKTTPSARQYGSFDDINTQFVNGDGSAWEFNAGTGKDNLDPRSGSGSRTQSPRRRSPERSDYEDGGPGRSTTADSGFNANGWSDKFSAQTFVPQQQPGTAGSPTRPTRGAAKKRNTKPTAGNAAVVEDSSDDEIYNWTGRGSLNKEPELDSPQAMDIDSPPVVSAEPSPRPEGARNIPVEPSRPEWRPGHVDASQAGGAVEKPFDPNAAGSEDTAEFRASLADLKDVEPLSSEQSAGLGGFNNMKDSLPFESRAAAGTPTIRLQKPPPLIFPNPPVAPRKPPSAAINGLKPGVTSWRKYLADFEDYLQKWDKFNDQVVVHFSTRKVDIRDARQTKGYSFLSTNGDADIQDYYSSMQQDNEVRRRWCQACEEHEARLREFMAFREKMKAT